MYNSSHFHNTKRSSKSVELTRVFGAGDVLHPVTLMHGAALVLTQVSRCMPYVFLIFPNRTILCCVGIHSGIAATFIPCLAITEAKVSELQRCFQGYTPSTNEFQSICFHCRMVAENL